MTAKGLGKEEILAALVEFKEDLDKATAQMKSLGRMTAFFGTYLPQDVKPERLLARRKKLFRKLSHEELLKLARAAEAMRLELAAQISENEVRNDPNRPTGGKPSFAPEDDG